MLAKRFRLPIENWSKEKNKKNITNKGKFFIAKVKNNGLNFSRFGVIVSAKVDKSAVKRNKLKRIIFNFVRLNKFFEIAGKDFLLVALMGASSQKKEQIEKDLYELLV